MVIRWIRWGMGAVAALGVIGLGISIFSQSDEERAAALREAEAGAHYEAVLPQAVAGDPIAQYELAELLRRGVGVARDPAKAMEWYRKAAEKAHIGAQYALGALYEKGDGVPQDLARAAEWYELAATLGRHPGAEFALGQMYYTGRGVANDPSEAVKWFRRAAERGHPAAQYVLGEIYETGWNVEADYAEAYKWYTLALPHRSQVVAVNAKYDPLKAREALVSKMTRFQMSRGEQWVREWRPAESAAAFVRPGATLVRPSPPETDAPPAPDPGLAVRLLALDAPFDGDKGAVTVSVIVDLADAGDRASVCGVAPRLREAVFQALWTAPIRERGGLPDLRGAEGRLLDPVNRALGRPAVRRVFLYPADRPLGANDLLRTPFESVAECPIPATAADP